MRAFVVSLFGVLLSCGGSTSQVEAGYPQEKPTPLPKERPVPTTAAPTASQRGASLPLPKATAAVRERWPDGVDSSLPAPQRATLLGIEEGGQRLLALSGTTAKPEHFTTSSEPGSPPATTQDVTYYVTVDAHSGCLTHSEAVPNVGRARTDQSMIERERLFEKPEVRNELGVMHALFKRFGIRGHDNIAFSLEGKNIFIESSSFISSSNDSGATFREFGPGAAAMPVVSPSGRYLAMRYCGSPCGGLYKLTILDLASGVRRSLGPEDTEEIFFAADDTLYAVRTNGGGLRSATQACVDQTTFPGWVSKRVGCRPIAGIGGGSSAIAANGKYLGLLGTVSSKERAFSLSLPEGKDAFAFEPPSAVVTGFSISNVGAIAYTLYMPQRSQDAVMVGTREVTPGYAAGWISDSEVAVVPSFPRSSDEPKPLQTLGDIGACGWLRAVPAVP